ncbi:Transposable element Tcb1 transposase-like 5 [Homarus americanus]|uniref:Transposable element Tcb1 transposase-like 5 n=1 Tax=Homarus americanus TaxID=6706 RepID=A0A8J5MWN6_HOMAM|nr:Transposable element Tcb1 transposase-like 5 [Homarus americanus]
MTDLALGWLRGWVPAGCRGRCPASAKGPENTVVAGSGCELVALHCLLWKDHLINSRHYFCHHEHDATALTTHCHIIALREEGLTVRDIADRLAVKRWIRRYAKTTVRSRLHEVGIQHGVPAKKKQRTEQHRTGRFQFAQQYVGEDLEFWSQVVFTDEKTFASTNHGKIHLWRPDRTRYNRAHIYEVARSGRVTLNVWGYISLHGMGDVFQIKGRFTANKYLDILRNQFLPSIHRWSQATQVPW